MPYGLLGFILTLAASSSSGAEALHSLVEVEPSGKGRWRLALAVDHPLR